MTDQVKHELSYDEKVDTEVVPRTEAEAWVDGLSETDFAIEQKKLLRKIDTRLLPTLFVLLILNYLDRNALASARVQGLEADLGLCCLPATFSARSLPTSSFHAFALRSTSPLFVALWGAVSTCTAASQNFTHLVVIRFFLGITESPYFPGALFLLSSWYTKRELAFRTSVLYTASLLSGAFGGLIAAGVQSGMDGVAGLASWRWLFILEGGVTICVALISAIVLPDYPATTRWLSDREKALAVARLQRDTGVVDAETMTLWQSFVAAATDYKLWVLALIIITKTTAGAVTQFIPTVVNTFGMDKVLTLVLTAPPYLFAAAISLWISWSSDRRPERCFHLLTPLLFGMVGFVVAATTKGTAPRYFSLFLMVGGMFGSYNVALAWISSTFARPRAKRAAAYATINSLGNIAQIWSPYLYDKRYGPKYTLAFSVNACMAAASVAFCLVLRMCLLRENRNMDAREEDPEEEKRIRYIL
ncbi:hypothetical protein CcaverHIS002_0301190 [Cutaneotrichosporon cavernicola]|nr:hypothetical protein CcaverHIS002_0301190 [Cutaneotrichosporon cavernicola]